MAKRPATAMDELKVLMRETRKRKKKPATAADELRALTRDSKIAWINAWNQYPHNHQAYHCEWQSEVVFHAERRWRFDWACQSHRIAVEVDGIGYRKSDVGRHQMGEGYENDCEKLNAAVSCGWSVFRFTPAMLARNPCGCVDLVVQVVLRQTKGDSP